jgi:hypothetical protein
MNLARQEKNTVNFCRCPLLTAVALPLRNSRLRKLRVFSADDLTRSNSAKIATASIAIPCGICEHDQPVAIVVDAVEVDALASLDVIVATLVVAEERRPLSFVAPFGVGRCKRKSLRQSDPGARALVEVHKPPGYVANADGRIVEDAASDVGVDPLVVDLQQDEASESKS